MKNEFQQVTAPSGYQFDAPSHALQAWSETTIQAAESSDKTIIDVNDMIGEDFWTQGFTEKKMAALLRAAGKSTDITVNINSPGGDVFQGVAIYSRLKQHQGNVTVNVLGVAASIASVVAMAGDTINMSKGSMLMVHNAWSIVFGNRHDMIDAADRLGKVDTSMIDIYSSRSGLSEGEVTELMNGKVDGTFLTAEEAINMGLADGELDIENDDAITAAKLPDDVLAKRRIEAALAAQGVTRKKRAEYLNNLTVESDTDSLVVRDADNSELITALTAGIATLKSK